MTTIFSLESYPEINSACLLFEDISVFNDDLSLKNTHRFYDERKDSTFVEENPVTQLNFNSETSVLKSLGLKLDDKSESLFIVPDYLDSLRMRDILDVNKDDKYIYKSAYYYWSYISQLQHLIPVKKPIIFLDLNQFNLEKYTYVELIENEKNLYPIPVLDKVNKIPLDIKINNDYRIYDRVIENIASKILEDYNKDIKSLEELTKYLKKIKLFQHNLTEPLFIEINYEDKIYYKLIQLNIDEIRNVVYPEIAPIIENIKNVVQSQPDYYFIVVSEFSTMQWFRDAFNQQNLVVPDTSKNEFTKIWQEKQDTELSLYGQYLDRIEFKFMKDNEPVWLKIADEKIYYEGDTETHTEIAKLDGDKSTFILKNNDVSLPIKINGEEYRKKDIPQAYYIDYPLEENNNTQDLKPIEIQIELKFLIGNVPKVVVRNLENNSILENIKMADIKTSQENCIPLEKIKSRRNQELQNPVRCQEIEKALSKFNSVSFDFENDVEVFKQVQQSMETRDVINIQINKKFGGKTDLLLNINPDHPLQKILNCNLIENICELIFRYGSNVINIPGPQRGEEYTQHRQRLIKWIVLIGKTYSFLPTNIIERFYEPNFIDQGRGRIGNEFFLFLARLARDKCFQIAYFNLFMQCYKLQGYLWGYARILLWYSDYDYGELELNYSLHFFRLLNYLYQYDLDNSTNLQDVFLCLIYMLTFREKNKKFCHNNSPEYKLAQRVIAKYQDQDIRNSALGEKSLVEYFKEYLEGTSSGENNLLNAD